jgi:hypothetical protein
MWLWIAGSGTGARAPSALDGFAITPGLQSARTVPRQSCPYV